MPSNRAPLPSDDETVDTIEIVAAIIAHFKDEKDFHYLDVKEFARKEGWNISPLYLMRIVRDMAKDGYLVRNVIYSDPYSYGYISERFVKVRYSVK